jgi:hypothetical protein
MVVLDLPVSLTDYKTLKNRPSFTIIVPSDSIVGESLTMSTLVNVLAFSLTDLEKLKVSDSKGVSCLAKSGYDINYIRECALRNVVSWEWKDNHGPSCVEDFIYATENPITLDDYVKIIFVKKQIVSLQELNKKYASEKPKSPRKKNR